MPSIAARHIATFTPALPPALPLVAVLAVAIALAQWPDGDIAGRDRELVARVTRAGQQRFDTEGGPHATDHGDVIEAGSPVATLDAAAETSGQGHDLTAIAAPPRSIDRPGWSRRAVVPEIRVTRRSAVAPPARGRAPPRA